MNWSNFTVFLFTFSYVSKPSRLPISPKKMIIKGIMKKTNCSNIFSIFCNSSINFSYLLFYSHKYLNDMNFSQPHLIDFREIIISSKILFLKLESN